MDNLNIAEYFEGRNILEIKKLAEKINLQNINEIGVQNQTDIYSNIKLTEPSNVASKHRSKQKQIQRNRVLEKIKASNIKIRDKPIVLPEKILEINKKSSVQPLRQSRVSRNSLIPTLETHTFSFPQRKSSHTPLNVVDPTKVAFGMVYLETTEDRIREKALTKLKWIVRMIMIWNRYLTGVADRAMRHQLEYLDNIREFHMRDEQRNIADKVEFSKSNFKSVKEIELSTESRNILRMDPLRRTDEQILTIIYGLSALSTFKDYPQHLQIKLCKASYFRKIGPNRVIIRQGHPAQYFYFIISGSAIVSHMTMGKTKTINRLFRGDSFGEMALLQHRNRAASVISVTDMQLLAIQRLDFFTIFCSSVTRDGELPEHIQYLKTVPIVQHLDLQELADNPEACPCNYYKNLSIITLNDKDSPYIYVVKYGQCMVIKEIKLPRKRFLPRENTMSLNDLQMQMDSNDNQLIFKPIALDLGIGNKNSPEKLRNQSYSYFYVKKEEEDSDSKSDFISIFLLLDILQANAVFGLSTLIFSDEDKRRTSNMASVALISKKCELILLSKRAVVRSDNQRIIDEIRENVYQYPPESEFLMNYKTHQQWNQYKIERYNSTLNKIIK